MIVNNRKLFTLLLVGSAIIFIVVVRTHPTSNKKFVVAPTPSPYPDTGKSCTDGSQCSSGWCVDHRCLEYQLNVATIGDYKAREVSINGKSFLVSALNSTITLTTNDENDPDFTQLKNKLCGIPEPTRSLPKSPFPTITCFVQTK